MAAKCANCGSADTYALLSSNGCYDCGKQTVTGDVEMNDELRAETRRPVAKAKGARKGG